MSEKVVQRFTLVVLVLAVVGFGYLISQVGLEKLKEYLGKVGVWFVPIILLEIGQHVLNTLGLRNCFPADREAIGFFRLLAVRLAGETVNMTTPTATVGGEMVKVSLLTPFGPPARITASVSQAYASQLLGQMIFAALLLPIALAKLSLPVGAKVFLGVAVIGGLVFAALFAHAVRAGPYGFLSRVGRRLGLGKEGGTVDTASKSVDEEARSLASARAAYAWSVAWFALGWAWGAVELVLIAFALGAPVGVLDCVLVESLMVFWDAVMFFVPGQLGTREAGMGQVFAALGHSTETGITFGCIRRVRQVTWMLIGLAALSILRRGQKDATAPFKEQGAASASRPDQASAGEGA